jgi:hypothetical protein
MSQNNPSMAEVLSMAISSRLAEINVSIPGRVVTYNRTKREATVQPLIRRAYVDADGERKTEKLPIIPGVPVQFPGGGVSGVDMSWSLAPGDLVLLMFCHASLDKWLEVGGEVDPGDDRRFNLSDAVAIPGIRPFKDRKATHESALVIDPPTGGEIHAGGTESLVTLAQFNAHTHTVATTGTAAAQTGTAAAPTPAAGTAVLKGA